jgi:hypothetical protein
LYPTLKEVSSSYFPIKLDEKENMDEFDPEDFMEGNDSDEYADTAESTRIRRN